MDTSLDETLSRLVTAFHVLHQHGVLDEHGYISVCNPHDPSTFFTSNIPAILVASKSDLNQWNVFSIDRMAQYRLPAFGYSFPNLERGNIRQKQLT
jgi:hypothetical protein